MIEKIVFARDAGKHFTDGAGVFEFAGGSFICHKLLLLFRFHGICNQNGHERFCFHLFGDAIDIGHCDGLSFLNFFLRRSRVCMCQYRATDRLDSLKRIFPKPEFSSVKIHPLKSVYLKYPSSDFCFLPTLIPDTPKIIIPGRICSSYSTLTELRFAAGTFSFRRLKYISDKIFEA